MGEKFSGKMGFPAQFLLHYLCENNFISEDY